jgi:ATP/ADP translocase
MEQAAIKLVQPRAARKPAVKRAATVKDNLTAYANSGVVIMAMLSALLNGYANAQHATIAWAGWGMGLIIPVIILILGKVASLLFKRGRNVRLAKITGGVGIGLLALSVWHCASSIALLTGSPLLLALPMAVAIDCGFVVCELAALRD